MPGEVDETVEVVVRGFGYEITHAARVLRTGMVPATHFGAAFTAVETPLVARCGNLVRSVQDTVVVMGEDAKVSCRHCRRSVARG